MAISTDTFSVDHISDLAEIPETRVRILIIRTADGAFEVRLSPWGSTIQVTDTDTLSKGVVAAIGEIFRQRRHSPATSILGLIAGLLFGMLAVVIVSLWVATLDTTGELQTDLDTSVGTTIFPAILLLIVALAVGRYGWVKRNFCQIITRTRAEAPSFLSRKKDDLVIEATVGVIFLALGGILGYWINTIT